MCGGFESVITTVVLTLLKSISFCLCVCWLQLKTSRQAYYASVTYVDEWVGLIYDMLEMKGLLKNTLVSQWASNGL